MVEWLGAVGLGVGAIGDLETGRKLVGNRSETELFALCDQGVILDQSGSLLTRPEIISFRPVSNQFPTGFQIKCIFSDCRGGWVG